MKQIYHPYNLWEDYQAGMYATNRTDQRKISACIQLLKSSTSLQAAMRHVATKWVYAAAVNLSNRSRNRQAWLGQAACCFKHSANEGETKLAWRKLLPHEQARANKIADQITEVWEGDQCRKNQLVLTF